ncbi:MAG: aminotransferase class I/II-fold pyridoxal phosphate-dependent enzyme [Clostridium sp.]|nr:aminotransferase class I/II-fold pyridoxal phosphate-dependent enzyme [Clostridium sp.]
MELNNRLRSIKTYPFHMPGHKRNEIFSITGADIDITEIDGFDNLHNPTEIIRDMEDALKKIFSSEKSIISVNGSTCCILAAISAVCSKGDKIVIARNCHKSVYNACYINELDITYLEPAFNYEYGIYTSITQESINEAIRNNPTAKAIVITSPTYEGFVSDVTASIPLIIDAAHGSHFGLADYFPSRAKGDIVIHSLHKTLPALTQTAAIHIYNSKYCDDVKKYMDVFESSSPSYILMASIDRCIDFINHSKKHFDAYKIILDKFYSKIKNLENVHLIKNDDISRLCILADGYSGYELAVHLRKNGIEVESTCADYVILISTVCDTAEGFDLLYEALAQIKHRNKNNHTFIKPEIPKKALNAHNVSQTEKTDINCASGKICGEYIYAYPPGVPIIVPGEIIEQNTIDYIKMLTEKKINVISDSNLLPNSILTKRNE